MKFRLASMIVLAAIAGSAHAQFSVTLYGNVDSGVLYQNTSARSFSTSAANTGTIIRQRDGGIYGSNWGIRGSEDLGGGYQINFRLQGVFNSSTGALGLADTPGAFAVFNQFAAVGASGPFGTFTIGRQIIPMIYAMAETDVRASQYFGSILTAWIGLNTAAGWPGTSTNTPIGALYDSNALVYRSPSFGGTTLELEYVPGEVSGAVRAGSRQSAVLKYVKSGLRLSAVYYNGYDTNPAPNTVSTGINNNRFIYFGGLYTFRDFTVSASYGNGKNPSNSNNVDLDMYSVGLGYQFAPTFKVTSGVYYLKDKNFSANRSTEAALGAEYSLSKRTTLYAQVGHVNNQGVLNQTIGFGQPVAPGLSTTATMIGLRHTF